jgi:hypothetical protein
MEVFKERIAQQVDIAVQKVEIKLEKQRSDTTPRSYFDAKL